MEITNFFRHLYGMYQLSDANLVIPFVAFLVPTAVTGSVLIGEWEEIVTRPVLINLIWFLILPIAAFVLVFTEVWGRNETHKSYHLVAFVMYETIGLIAIATCAYPMKHLFSIENAINAFRNTLSDKTLLHFAGIMHSIIICFLLISHWMKNTIVHMSLCRTRILSRGPMIDPYEWNIIWILITGTLCFILILYTVYMEMFTEQHCEYRFPVVGIMIILVFTALLCCSGSDNTDDTLFGYKINYRVLYLWLALITIFFTVLQVQSNLKGRNAKNAFSYSYSSEIMFVWICGLSIGRQWCLELELQKYPEKYEDRFEDEYEARIYALSKSPRLASEQQSQKYLEYYDVNFFLMNK